MKFNKKIYIGILFTLLIFFLLMFFLFGRDYLKKSKDTFSIIIGNDTIWSYHENHFVNRMNSSFDKEYNNQDYYVFMSDQKFHSLTLFYPILNSHSRLRFVCNLTISNNFVTIIVCFRYLNV